MNGIEIPNWLRNATGVILTGVILLEIEYCFFVESPNGNIDMTKSEQTQPLVEKTPLKQKKKEDTDVLKSYEKEDYQIQQPLAKPKISILPDWARQKKYHWFTRFLGWAFLIASFFTSMILTANLTENNYEIGCLGGLLIFFALIIAFYLLFRWIGIGVKIFSFIYTVQLYEDFLNWLYGLL